MRRQEVGGYAKLSMPKSKADQRSEPKSKKRKILVADESITIQKLVNLTFATRSVEVITASDGPDAMTKVKRLHPDVVLVDAYLRQVNGVDICENIRADASLSRIAVVLLKGKVSKEFEDRIAKLKVDEILVKPFDSKALATVVDRLLGDDETTITKEAGPFSTQSLAQQKLEAASAEVIQESSESEAETLSKRISTESETVTKKAHADEVHTLSPVDEASVTVKEERLRPSRDQMSREQMSHEKTTREPNAFQEPLVVKAQPVFQPTTPPAIDLAMIEKMAKAQIQEWVEKNLPPLTEKLLKDEIARLTQSQ